jgi:hypothetical protein
VGVNWAPPSSRARAGDAVKRENGGSRLGDDARRLIDGCRGSFSVGDGGTSVTGKTWRPHLGYSGWGGPVSRATAQAGRTST